MEDVKIIDIDSAIEMVKRDMSRGYISDPTLLNFIIKEILTCRDLNRHIKNTNNALEEENKEFRDILSHRDHEIVLSNTRKNNLEKENGQLKDEIKHCHDMLSIAQEQNHQCGIENARLKEKINRIKMNRQEIEEWCEKQRHMKATDIVILFAKLYSVFKEDPPKKYRYRNWDTRGGFSVVTESEHTEEEMRQLVPNSSNWTKIVDKEVKDGN